MEKGKLKIFFGYSAGVGKTYAMLSNARDLKKKGVDAIIGYIEPHTRPDTAELAEGLETIPVKKIEYRGIKLNEFDVDAAKARCPELILVDELAHTNAEGSKHKKRYQDVLELLNNGINVYTTINVQHLEGLNDIIDNATTVRVGETVPDELFDKADEVELIDIEPGELMERLRSGKIYHGERITTALEHFFTQENLNNLREVAMRRCADRIVKKGVNGEVSPKVLVLISPSPSSQKNIRIAARMADNYHCKFSAMYVERNGELDDQSAENLKSHIKLVNDLGGEIIIKYGDRIVETIETYVKLNGITNIIIGKTWQSIGKKVGLEEQIISSLPDIEVLIVPDRESAMHKKKMKTNFNNYDKGFIILFAIVLIGTIVFAFFSKVLAIIIVNLISIFLFAVLLFIRKQNISISGHFKQSNRALDCINLLSNCNRENDIKNRMIEIAKILTNTFERSTQIVLSTNSTIQSYNKEDCSFFNSQLEEAVKDWCQTNNKIAGKGTDTLRNANAIYFPLTIRENKIASISFSCKSSKLNVTDKILFSQLKSTIAILLSL